MTGVSLQKGDIWTGHAPREDTTGPRRWSSTNQGGRPGTSLSLTALGRDSLYQHLQNLGLQNCEIINVCCLSHPAVALCYSSPSTQILLPWGAVEGIPRVVRWLTCGWMNMDVWQTASWPTSVIIYPNFLAEPNNIFYSSTTVWLSHWVLANEIQSHVSVGSFQQPSLKDSWQLSFALFFLHPLLLSGGRNTDVTLGVDAKRDEQPEYKGCG